MKEDIGHRRKKNLLKNVVFAMIPTVMMTKTVPRKAPASLTDSVEFMELRPR